MRQGERMGWGGESHAVAFLRASIGNFPPLITWSWY
jgi:hypothetical protein